MAETIKTMVGNPALEKGSDDKKAVKALVYIGATAASTLLGIWVNRTIKAKAPTWNPLVVDGLQIGGGVAMAVGVKHPIAQSIGVGQGVAGAIGLMDKGIVALRSKIMPVAEGSPAYQTITGW